MWRDLDQIDEYTRDSITVSSEAGTHKELKILKQERRAP
jgi:hypothetical protein